MELPVNTFKHALAAGKPQKQSVAIAYAMKRKAQGKKGK